MTPDDPQLTPAEEDAYRREQADYDSHLTGDEPKDNQEGDDQ